MYTFYYKYVTFPYKKKTFISCPTWHQCKLEEVNNPAKLCISSDRAFQSQGGPDSEGTITLACKDLKCLLYRLEPDIRKYFKSDQYNLKINSKTDRDPMTGN